MLALANQAVKTHRRARFFNLVDLVNRLEQEKTAGKQGRPAQRLTHVDVVVMDELGYLPVSANGGALQVHLISRLCGRTSLIITTNQSFSEWGKVFDDAKMATALPAKQPQIQGENPHPQPLKPHPALLRFT